VEFLHALSLDRVPADVVDRAKACLFRRSGKSLFIQWRIEMHSFFKSILVGSLAALALAGSSAVGQGNDRLSMICGECKVEKYASCPGKFLEGPNFDKKGNLWMVALASGELLKVGADRQCVVARTGINFPGGSRFDKNGKWILTSRQGLLSFDTETNELTTLVSTYGTEVFRGLNDVIVDKANGIYFTEPNGSNLIHPNGRLFYLPPSRKAQDLRIVVETIAFPNGLALSRDESVLYIAEYSLNRTDSIPLRAPGDVANDRVPYVFAYLTGGVGPDGLLVDSQDNLYQAHYMAGEVTVHDPSGFPIGNIKMPSEAGLGTTNLAFRDGYLYITEAKKGEVWRVKTNIPGNQ
jgi:gluconolactonase